jgi:hypothetical protein
MTMTTANRMTTISLSGPSTPRLRMEPTGSRRTFLDGGWWPRSTDPVAELLRPRPGHRQIPRTGHPTDSERRRLGRAPPPPWRGRPPGHTINKIHKPSLDNKSSWDVFGRNSIGMAKPRTLAGPASAWMTTKVMGCLHHAPFGEIPS